jgi:hypothetical protein
MAFDTDKPCPCGLRGKSYGDCCEPQAPDALGNAMQRGSVEVRLPGTRTETRSSWVSGDTRFRIVWNQLWTSPQQHTFHEFLDCLTVRTLGQDWFKQQMLPSVKKPNAIVRWRESLRLLLDRPANTPDDGHTFTGPVKAYISFAYDLYWLQLVHKLPDNLVERLRDFSEFEGARYEILIAAVFVRAGFEIDWLDNILTKGKHCEFIATHKRTGEKIGVETKFRRRSGLLNFIGGAPTPETHLKGDIFGLYEKAVQQAPADRIPFLIFIDANVLPILPVSLPVNQFVSTNSVPWMKEIEDELSLRWSLLTGKTAETGVFVTNIAFHYGNDADPSPAGTCAVFPSLKPNKALRSNEMIKDLAYCLHSYGQIPRQV